MSGLHFHLVLQNELSISCSLPIALARWDKKTTSVRRFIKYLISTMRLRKNIISVILEKDNNVKII